MGDKQILTELIKPSALVDKETNNDKHFVKLIESMAPDSNVIVRNLPDDALIIKADVFHPPKEIFQDKKRECKRADYVIICEENKCLIYIELKSRKDSWDIIVKQLMGAECFIKYCREIGRAFWKTESFLENYQSRFISICNTSINKKPTGMDGKAKDHDKPEKAWRLYGYKNLEFNKIA